MELVKQVEVKLRRALKAGGRPIENKKPSKFIIFSFKCDNNMMESVL